MTDRRFSPIKHDHDGVYAEAEHTHVKAEITDFAHTHVSADVTDLSTTYLPIIGEHVSDLNVTNVDTAGEFGHFASTFLPSNDPGAASNYYAGIEIKQWLSQDYRVQLAFGTTDGDANIRYKTDGTWGSWKTLWHSGNDGSGSGLDADTLDGVDGANYVRLDTTHLGKTGAVTLDAVTNTAAEWSALPVGYSRMMNAATIGTAGGAPIDSSYGYFTKIANRDLGGGWGGLWCPYDATSTGGTYVGHAATDATLPTWRELYSSVSQTIRTNSTISQGNIGLQNGGANPGYIEIFNAGNTRVAYLGFTDGASSTVFGAENGWGFCLQYGGTNRIKVNSTGMGFFAATPVAKPTVTGAKGGNAALTSLCTALANLGLITNSTT